MPDSRRINEAVPVSRIFLSLQNPRHVPVDSETKAIARLCEKENVYQLARDIAMHGLNPLERFALVPTGGRATGSSQNYFVAEGNRRICALKLLGDPDLAPANLRKSFEKLSSGWVPVTTVSGVIFGDVADVELWLDRIHSGEQNGRGRKNWNSEQKSRFDGGNKNRLAQNILDYAEMRSMISNKEREGKLTTAQRFLNNDVFRETLGLDASDPEDLLRTRSEAEFDTILRRFMRDLADVERKVVTSRMNKAEIIKYARPLGSLPGVTAARIQPESLSIDADDQKTKKGRKDRSKAPSKVSRVLHQDEIGRALDQFGNEKLKSLYYSICQIELDPHTPIIAVGTWAFFETLTACAGRNERTDFCSFLNKAKLSSYGFTGDTLSYRTAMERIKDYGNSTKHHPVSATFNGDQLNNDMTSLKEVILRAIEEAVGRRP